MRGIQGGTAAQHRALDKQEELSMEAMGLQDECKRLQAQEELAILLFKTDHSVQI